MDSAGRSVSTLDIYRCDYQDGSVPRGYMDDATAQIEAAGYERAPDPNRPGYWRWERANTSSEV